MRTLWTYVVLECHERSKYDLTIVHARGRKNIQKIPFKQPTQAYIWHFLPTFLRVVFLLFLPFFGHSGDFFT
jgi:hypothetical protein